MKDQTIGCRGASSTEEETKKATSSLAHGVPKGRFELPRANAHYALNVARLPIPPLRRGGAEGTRTPDLNTASVALSQLSYSPEGDPCADAPRGT